MKYFIIAGEASGDMHGAKLMSEIKRSDPTADFMFLGGDLMKNQGGILIRHYSDMAFMGIVPVILNIRSIQRNFKQCEKELLVFHPDVLILIDYPGFNLRIARFAKENKIKTVYYISPKIWAWKTGRVKKVKKYIDHMFTIFPFETEFYKKFGYNVTYVGNPVYDIIREELNKKLDFEKFCISNHLPSKPVIALLAGSRKHEIKSLLPVMEQVSFHFKEFQFIISGAPSIGREFYKTIMKFNLPVLFDQTYELLRYSKAAIVASGTATLETALLKIPQVVCYKMGLGWFLELFRSQILKTRFFSLVNLVAGKEVVKELFQSQVTVTKLRNELSQLLVNESYRNEINKGYSEIELNLSSEGAASITARHIVDILNKKLCHV
jgi:lipid-A-disaccharide synthase